jgi:hypothetical protein
MENSKPTNADEANSGKSQADSADKTDMLQHEKLIDPGNEHSHHVDDEIKPGENKEARFDAEAGEDKSEPETKQE